MAPQLQPREPDPPRVLVLGGGLAGIAAACHLVERGLRVTLVEKRPYLGGRAFSFTDPETGCQVDNGQHVFLGCCTQYIQLLQRLGTQEQAFLQPRFSMKVVDPQGRAELLASAFLLAPFHLLPALLRYPYLTWGERLRAVITLGRIRFTDRRHPSLEGETFAHWLRRHGQSERAIRSLWNLIILPALNDDITQVSTAMGLMVFQEGVLKGRHSANIGYARVGLSALMGDAAQRYLEHQGAQLLLGKSVQRLLYQDGRITGVTLTDQQVLTADVFISALPFDLLHTVLPPPLAGDPFFARAQGLSTSPIVNLHIWYDRPVLQDDFVAVLDSPLQWVFNKSRIFGEQQGNGQYLSLSLSGAWEYIDQPKDQLRELFLAEMARVFPQARSATVERFLVVKQERATFRCTPGAAGHRLPAATPVPNLVLAGEWTDTGWPSTMEGAVRSGNTAAQEVLRGTWR